MTPRIGWIARFRWLRTAGRGPAVAALAVLITGGLITDGRVQTTASVLVAVWLFLGLVVLSLSHAHEAGRLPHHLTFAAVFVAGCVGGSLLWEATTAILPDLIAAGIGVGVWVMASWAGSKLAYSGPLDRVLDRVGGPGG